MRCTIKKALSLGFRAVLERESMCFKGVRGVRPGEVCETARVTVVMDPPSLISPAPEPEPDTWWFPLAGIPPGSRDASGGESTVTDHSRESRGRRKRNDSAAAAEDESSKLISSSSGNDLTKSDVKRVKVNGDSKAEAESTSGICNKSKQNAQPSEPPKQDYIHVKARRGQATDSHSLAERARRERISERMKILQGLVPGCNKVIGKSTILDEIINYIQALQRQAEFLSMKLEAVNSCMDVEIEGFSTKEFGTETYGTSPSLGFISHPTRDYGKVPTTDWLHMQVGAFESVT